MALVIDGQVRRSQVITTWGPGALLDLPERSAIVGGLETWPKPNDLDEIIEERLTQKLKILTGIVQPRLYAPPANSTDPSAPRRGIGVWEFPEWFLVQEETREGGKERSRRLVHRKGLDSGKGRKFEKKAVVPTRFVRACPRGHVDDIDWKGFVHGPGSTCGRQLWLDESGTGGDLADLTVRCECEKRRSMYEATEIAMKPLGKCSGARPWLGRNTAEPCDQPARLLIRTASNAYFPQGLVVLSLPQARDLLQETIAVHWEILREVESENDLKVYMKIAAVGAALADFPTADVLKAIEERKAGATVSTPVKLAELEALLGVPEGFGDDVPTDTDFHARRLPRALWDSAMAGSSLIASVIQVHRLREVMALAGFTRFESFTPDIHGEYDSDVERADLALDPQWFPAVENRGEGVFVELGAPAVAKWLDQKGTKDRIQHLAAGHAAWWADKAHKPKHQPAFPGGVYVLAHTLAHLFIESMSMRCGYPASSIRERVYVDEVGTRYGFLLYTGSPDAEGTLGGLVQQGRDIEAHLAYALRSASLCSNDPICAMHEPDDALDQRWLLGASCHACTLISETSCEMRNDYLDRALVVPVLGLADAAFFPGT